MEKNRKKTNIGGQALFEGILMKGPLKTAIAIRKNDGDIELKLEDRDDLKKSIFNLPFLRGIKILFSSLKDGRKALEYSLSFDEEYKKEMEESDNLKGKIVDSFILLVTFLLVIGFFFILPGYISKFLSKFINSRFLLNLIEGLFRILVFVIYVSLIAMNKEINRVFMYHGAEHKAINAYEFGQELTIENVRKQSRLHPRCGTSFIFNFVIIASIVFSFIEINNPLIKLVIRLLFIPIIVGITYELNLWMGRSDSYLARVLSKLGMTMQKYLTVREPDDSMIEVSIQALKGVIGTDYGN